MTLRALGEELPASVVIGNIMVATWVISPVCETRELDKRLKEAPFDIVVLVMSTAVAEGTPVFKYLVAAFAPDA